MAEIVDFRRPPTDADLQWRCCCGCETFYVRCDQTLVCANCNEVAVGPEGDWTKVLKPVAPPETEATEGLVVRSMATSAAAARRSLDGTDPNTVVAFMAIKPDGSATTFCRAETGEQYDWLERQIKGAVDLLMKDRPK